MSFIIRCAVICDYYQGLLGGSPKWSRFPELAYPYLSRQDAEKRATCLPHPAEVVLIDDAFAAYDAALGPYDPE